MSLKNTKWTIEWCQLDSGLRVQDTLTFEEPVAVNTPSKISVKRTDLTDPNNPVTDNFDWGTWSELSEVKALITYGGQNYDLTRNADMLTCTPFVAPIVEPVNPQETESANSSLSLNTLLGAVGGIAIGAAVGSLLDVPVDVALALATTATLGQATVSYLISQSGDGPGEGDPGVSWTAQVGGGGPP